MLEEAWLLMMENKMFVLVPRFDVDSISLESIIPALSTARGILELYYKCERYGCDGVMVTVSVVATVVVVATLIYTIIWSERRDKHNSKQIEHMNSQVGILIQNNRMSFLKEYMTALSIKVFSRINISYRGKGLSAVEGENGIILAWNVIKNEYMLDYRFCVTIRCFSGKLEDQYKILEKKKYWWDIYIEIIRLNDVSYVMTGYARDGDNYRSIESEFHNMNEETYNNIMLIILSSTSFTRKQLVELQNEFNKHIKNNNPSDLSQ